MQDGPANRLDLNLLAIFDTIMSERSLTKAGQRLGMTQSAVSHALARLREVTGDMLFERTGRGVRPTARAVQMAASVRQALDQLRSTLRQRPSDFCSATAERTFLLDIPAGIDMIIAPALASRTMSSPGLSFRISGGRAHAIMHELRFGETWLALDYEKAEVDGYRSELLFEDPFVIVARPGHEILDGELTRERFAAIEQVAFVWGRELGQSPLLQRLARLGIERSVKYTVPTLASVAAVVATSGLAGVLPLKVARGFGNIYAIEWRTIPFAVPPMPIYSVWHENFDNDEGHIWLRTMLKEIAEEV